MTFCRTGKEVSQLCVIEDSPKRSGKGCPVNELPVTGDTSTGWISSQGAYKVGSFLGEEEEKEGKGIRTESGRVSVNPSSAVS